MTTYVHQGYGSRLIDSIKGVVVGIIFFLVSIPLLWWNEGRAVQTAKSLAEGASSVVHVEKLDPANAGKLVHVSAEATSVAPIADHDFGVEVHALKLQRDVEMFQFYERSESRETIGGGKETRYWCEKKWSAEQIGSSGFHDKGLSCGDNPQMSITRTSFEAKDAKLGEFALSAEILADSSVNSFSPVALDPSKLPVAQHGRVKTEGSVYFIGRGTLQAPEIGDTKVSYQSVNSPATMSIIAEQSGSGFQKFQAKAGDAYWLIAMRSADAQTMFKQAEAENAMLTWILRGVGFFAMTMGIWLFLRPIAMVANFIPFAGSFVSFGAFLIALFGAAGLSLTTIAIAWIFYRPILGGILLGGALLGLVIMFVMMGRARASKRARGGMPMAA